jgi:hypothetical protein
MPVPAPTGGDCAPVVDGLLLLRPARHGRTTRYWLTTASTGGTRAPGAAIACSAS